MSLPHLIFCRLVIAVSLLLSLTSCKKEIEIKDGVVPPEYQAILQPWLGSYTGHFSYSGLPDSSTTVYGFLDSYDRLRLQFRDFGPLDYLGLHCGSRVGLLNRVVDQDGSGKSLTLRFGFEPGPCIKVEGRNIEIELSQTTSGRLEVRAKLLKEFELREHCTTSIGNDPTGGMSPVPVTQCKWDKYPLFYEGTFYR